jgi:hypothetical protein
MTYCLAPVVEATHGVDLGDEVAMNELADSFLTILFDGLLAKPKEEGDSS